MRACCRVLWNTNHISRNTPVSARFDHATMHVKPSETLRGFKGLRDLPHSGLLRATTLAMLGTWRLCRHLAYAHVDRTAAVLFLLTFMLLCSCVAVHELLFPYLCVRTDRQTHGRTDRRTTTGPDRQTDRQTARQAGSQPSIPPSLHQSIHPSVHPSLHAHYKVVLCIYIYIYTYIDYIYICIIIQVYL